jgi:lipopolysaccharide biosynthesis glycosyltransferase
MFKRKSYCLCTVSDRRFLPGTLVLLHSFLQHNSWYKGDIVVFSEELTAADFQDFTFLENLRVEAIAPEVHQRTEQLAEAYERFRGRKGQFYSLEAFRLYDYDRVLFLDSDLLIRKSFKSLFKQKGELLVVADGFYYLGKYRDPRTYHKVSKEEATKMEEVWTDTFSSGMMMIDKKALTPTDYQAMVNRIDIDHFREIISSHSDQMVINQHFRGRYSLVSAAYNYRFFIREQIERLDQVTYDEVAAVHYTAKKKPWEPSHVVRTYRSFEDYPRSFDEWQVHWKQVLESLPVPATYIRPKKQGRNSSIPSSNDEAL